MDMFSLKKVFEADKYEEIEQILDQIAEGNYIESTPFLIQQLETTNNHMLRNKIALTLSDMACVDAVVPIINLLNNPKTLGYRGTLLYALTPFDYSPFADMLLGLLLTGNYEVRHNSFSLLEDIIKKIPSVLVEKYIIEIESEIKELSDKTSFLSDALDMLHTK